MVTYLLSVVGIGPSHNLFTPAAEMRSYRTHLIRVLYLFPQIIDAQGTVFPLSMCAILFRTIR